MSSDIKKLDAELQDLKKQLNLLFDEVQTLKENYQSLGYNSDDNLITKREKEEVDKIRSAIKKGDFSNLTELD